jgi:DNA helicase-2/ATP-dependent DNA helicase PcrA
MINTSPYNQASESVQLMTVFKSKGLEFERVFLLGCVDEVWGEKARGNSNKLTLPANLASIRRAGASEDERLRILYVAMTRAKLGLYLTSYSQAYSGKATTRLKYLYEREQEDGSFRALALPEKYQLVQTSDSEVPALAALETNWRNRYMQSLADASLKALLSERLENYQLSPTHLNTFIDMKRGGPREFLLNTLLRFPQAPGASGQFGNAIHETLEWYQHQVNAKKTPGGTLALTEFEKRMLAKGLEAGETKLLIERGKLALTSYLKSASFKPGDRPEAMFKNEGVFVGDARLGGKIDKLELNPNDKTLIIVDYKTGKPSEKWASDIKFHKYKQQLYIYKMLIEASNSYKGWTVAGERLDFIEPDASGNTVSLELKFNQKEFDETKLLLEIMWRKVMALDLPDTGGYSKNMAGTKKFEQDLLDGKA